MAVAFFRMMFGAIVGLHTMRLLAKRDAMGKKNSSEVEESKLLVDAIEFIREAKQEAPKKPLLDTVLEVLERRFGLGFSKYCATKCMIKGEFE